jgi:hypothetical protein
MASILNATTSSGLVTSADNSGSLQLATNNGTTALTIDTSQNVGIGTGSPAYALDVRSTTAPAIRLSRSGSAGQIASMVFEDGNATLGAGSTTRVASDAGAMSFSTGGTSGAVTGGTERMRIDSSGRVTIPYQPSFHVRVNNGSYLTTSPIPFSNSVFDVGSNFNTSTYRFTAPIAGKYYFVLNMYLVCDNGEDAYPRFRVNGSNRQYSYFFNNGAGGAIDNTTSVNAIFNLSVSDYVDVTFNGGGTYYGGNQETNFYGYLIG